jgi:hypothetical protein
VRSATIELRSGFWHLSSDPLITSTGQRTASQIARDAGVSRPAYVDAYSSVSMSAPDVIDQTTQSSTCFVECGSGNISPKKNSDQSRQSCCQ